MEVTQDAICYYHVRRNRRKGSSRATGGGSSSLERSGDAKLIPLGTVRRFGVQRDDKRVLILQCAEREFFFRLPSKVSCDEWVERLCNVAAVQAAAEKAATEAAEHAAKGVAEAADTAEEKAADKAVFVDAKALGSTADDGVIETSEACGEYAVV